MRVGGFVCPSVCRGWGKVINAHTQKKETADEKLHNPESVSARVCVCVAFCVVLSLHFL